MRNNRGFTLIELIIVIIVLAIMAAVAIPKFFDIKTDAQKSAVQGALGGVRSAIANYKANQNLKGLTPVYPAVGTLTDGTSVMDGVMPDNPYSTLATKNDVADTASVKGTQPCIEGGSGSTKAWCYNATAGTFWANTAVAGENNF